MKTLRPAGQPEAEAVWRQRRCVEGSQQQKADSESDSQSEGQGIKEKLWLSSELGDSGGE